MCCLIIFTTILYISVLIATAMLMLYSENREIWDLELPEILKEQAL